jgi:hypothetical protein
MLVAYAPPILSIGHAVLPQSVVVFLDIPSHCRRIVLRCTHTHNSSVHSFRCFTCILPLGCVLFLPCCWCVVVVVVVVSYWSAAPTCVPSSLLLHALLLFLSRHDQSVLLANFCSSACASPLYHLVFLHPAKGFASQAPEYILFTFLVTSL